VGYLIVAGGGRLAVNRKIPHPVKKFFSMSRAGGMTALSGYLDIAMKKAGSSEKFAPGRVMCSNTSSYDS
jgi:hypothetical protein